MDKSVLIYSLAIGWFTYHMFWMAMRIYQFAAFPRTYGYQPNIGLRDLAETAVASGKDLPAFRIVVPAYQEVAVIEGTLRQLAGMNFPRSHFQVYVVTYADEPVVEGAESTATVVERVAQRINAGAEIELIRLLVTPAGFDGYFPGDLDADIRHIGKARGLNYALRCIHEENERDERRYYIGKLRRIGHYARVERALAELEYALEAGNGADHLVDRLFDPESRDHLGPIAVSRQLQRLLKLTANTGVTLESKRKILDYVESEAARFFLQLLRSASPQPDGVAHLAVSQDKEFLYEQMLEVEHLAPESQEAYSIARETELARVRPLLHQSLEKALDPAEIFELARRLNSRWLLVYDADSDPPADVLRHVAARIMTDAGVMGFQGPVAPLLNYDDVHPLCRMGGLWMGFWHGSAYPRLLHKQFWAHPLAGTNWCFRIEGFEHEGRLIRDCPYDEGRRRFLLYFNPTHLTEDLEAGVRNFSEWSVNAEWHPVVEMEQVAPTPRAMFVQHSRWAYGTLQTMHYIVRSRLPLVQKTWFLMYPLRVLFASSGPFITIALVTAFILDALIILPVFAWWALFLTVGNLVYAWAFIKTFQRYYDMHHRAYAVDYLYRNAAEITRRFRQSENGTLTSGDAHLMLGIVKRIDKGLSPGGFITEYIERRCLDNAPPKPTDERVLGHYIRNLLNETPTRLGHAHVVRVISELRNSVLNALPHAGSEQPAKSVPRASQPKDSRNALGERVSELAALLKKADAGAGANRWPRWSRYHTQILVWAIPFVYFSVTPFFRAFWLWSKGTQVAWHKTERTPKGRLG